MEMRQGLLLLLLSVLPFAGIAQDPTRATWQNPFEKQSHSPVYAYFGGGAMYYWGDLSDGFESTFLRPSANSGIMYYLRPHLSVKIGVTGGTVFADDAKSKYLTHQARNLHFRSRISEVNSMVVLEVFKNQWLNSKYVIKLGKIASPYFFAGVAVYHFNPQGELEGEWIDLQPLGTEGQFITKATSGEPLGDKYPEPYDRWGISIPLGGGIKFNCSEKVSLGFEAATRKTFTDYLDDVSTFYVERSDLKATPNGLLAVRMYDRSNTALVEGISYPGAIRGNPEMDDWYFDFAISLYYYLNETKK